MSEVTRAAHVRRTCVGCRAIDAPTRMVRVVIVASAGPQGQPELAVDRLGHAPGRGAWIHPNDACVRAAFTRRGFTRAFRAHVCTARLERELEADMILTRGTEPLLEAG